MDSPTILVVDDDPDMIEALRLPLEARGYVVFQANSGRSALEQVKKVKPDLIILDVMMESDTAGFQTAYVLRNPDSQSPYAAFAKIPIVMLTAIATEKRMTFSPETDHGFLPVDVFLEKPVRPEALLEHVAALLRNTSLSRR